MIAAICYLFTLANKLNSSGKFQKRRSIGKEVCMPGRWQQLIQDGGYNWITVSTKQYSGIGLQTNHEKIIEDWKPEQHT